MIDFTHFQIEMWLRDINYPFATSGENISKKGNWIGINCPFCITPDTKNHLGINLLSKSIKCWRCGTGGSIIRLIMKIAHAPYEHIPDIITKYSIKKQLDISLPRRQIKELSFPSNTTEELVQSHVNYLQKRNFDPKYLQIKYHIKSIGPASERAWSNRILIPYLFKERIVTFTARDSTEFEWRPRYKACLPEESEIPIDHILYNINSVKEIAVIVEGPTDVWRMGDGFVAMGGLQWNSQRIYLLKDCKQVFIWPDKEHAALLFWEKLAHSLSFIKDVRFVELSEGDPGSLDEDSARNFRREIFGRKYR